MDKKLIRRLTMKKGKKGVYVLLDGKKKVIPESPIEDLNGLIEKYLKDNDAYPPKRPLHIPTTVAKIKDELDKRNIKYKNNAKKSELIKLLKGDDK